MKSVIHISLVSFFLSFCTNSSEKSKVFDGYNSSQKCFVFTGDVMVHNGATYEGFNFKNDYDSIFVFLGIENDTLFALKNDEKCLKKFIFLPLIEDDNNTFYFSDYFCNDKKATYNDAAGELIKSYHKSNDTFYVVRHRTLSKTIYDMQIKSDSTSLLPYANKFRSFTFSKKRGCMSFETVIRNGKDTLDFPF